MTDRASRNTRQLNAWGWIVSLALVSAGLISNLPLPAPGIGIGGAEVFVAAALVFIWVHIGGAVGLLVGLVAGTLACRGWLVPRLKQRPGFSRLVAVATPPRRGGPEAR